jgi:hypothetical protein
LGILEIPPYPPILFEFRGELVENRAMMWIRSSEQKSRVLAGTFLTSMPHIWKKSFSFCEMATIQRPA